MMKYRIFFADGKTLKHTGHIDVESNCFYCYGEDDNLSLIIPLQQVKYIEVDN